uniref:eRF1/Pelota-like N-terminal domain-containing protein n=1 Tax=Aureoumbra lagunensis TaxID=44058 RepID=A0A7S3K686_9STRA
MDVDDFVKASTYRKIESSGSSGGSEKRRVTLTLRATKIEYDGLSGSVRISGTNVCENEWVKMGAHHTTEIATRSTITLTKASWDAGHRASLFEERKTGEAVAVLTQSGGQGITARVYALSGALSRHIGSIDISFPKSEIGKQKARKKFINQLYSVLNERVDWEYCKCLALAGPEATSLANELVLGAPKKSTDKIDGLTLAFRANRVVTVSNKSGISTEVLESLLADKGVAALVAATSLAEHYEALEEFRAAELKDATRVVYGSLAAAQEAADRAAISTLLVLDDKLKSAHDIAQRRALTHLIDTASSSAGQVLVFPARHVAAQRLALLGGIAAILRFPCPDLQDITDTSSPQNDDDSKTVLMQDNFYSSSTTNAPPQPPAAPRRSSSASTTTSLSSTKHIEVKQKVLPSTKSSAAAGNLSSSSSNDKNKKNTAKKLPKPNFTEEDDDYCDDDYYDY